MKLTSESKFFFGILAATALIIGGTVWFFSRPAPTVTNPRETLIPADANTKGNKDASVYLVEFSDFQCPACAAFAPTVDSLTEKYKDRMLFAYRHYPLPQHEFARPAAYAAEAAGLQGKFWEAAALLFKNQDTFSQDFFTNQFVQLVSLDKSKYARDAASDTAKERVERDFSQAQLLGLRSTPTFFLNGVLLTNLYTPQDLVKAVEEAIK